LATQRLTQLWKNEYFRTAIMILVIVGVVFGFWYGTRWVLNTDNPMLAVASGSMSLPKGTVDDGWSHPFDPTLRIGDLIIVQGVKPEDVYAAPFNASGRSGDILVFRAIDSDELIVHRAVGETVVNGTVVNFTTEGDNNPGPGPSSPTPVENVVGKVVMRIPWVGHLALFMQSSDATVLIAILIIVLILVEFALPARKRDGNDQGEHPEGTPKAEGTA
jgi:signal peptidase